MKLGERIKKIGYDKMILALIAGIILISFSWPFKFSAKDNEEEKGSLGQETGISAAEQGDALAENEQSAKQVLSSQEQYRKALEEQLKALLEKMEGVGSVEVMVTLKGTGEIVLQEERVYANDYDAGTSGGSTSLAHSEGNYTTVILEDGEGKETPVVIQVYNPKVEGVVVVAQGADSAVIKSEITDAVMVLFHIESHKIKVVTMSDLE